MKNICVVTGGGSGMGLAAAALVSLILMFAVKNHKVRQISFYGASALSLYIGYAAFRILYPAFVGQLVR